MNIQDYKLAQARSRNTSPEVLDQLADDNDDEIIYYLVHNQNLLSKTLEKLSKHEDDMIRYLISEHRNISPELLITFSDDPDWEVQWNVALNEKTPIEILLKLSDNGRHWEVANTAKSFYNKRIKETSIGTKIVNWFRAII